MPSIWPRARATALATVKGFSALQLPMIAAAIAFYGILALFPALTALVAVWSVFADPAVVQSQLDLAAPFLPPEVYTLIGAQLGKLVATDGTTLGWASVLSLGAALWSARLGVAGLMQGLNATYREEERSALGQTAASLSITVMLIAVAVAALAAVVAAPVLLELLPLGPAEAAVFSAIRWLIVVGLLLMALSVLYRFGPNRSRATTPFLTPGAVLAVVMWGAVSWGLTVYLANFADYNEVYGTLGAVIALLMWLWLSAIAVLAGALLNAEWEARAP